ncbi:NusG domain II-containing protein [Anoxynatronum buryatiense]|uniref:NusG domain-containing protein n=1 Tax=Anoxynatronum buryatiense TaxID=489973 RepID=A0AA46AJF0_9CLOT|nr:NusG domain II-containing protein [Anoxynatronum buryatiense]SMP61522.1 hypothetical protein SAMN06296020_10970 [Anoxynatronum buryatiense]
MKTKDVQLVVMVLLVALAALAVGRLMLNDRDVDEHYAVIYAGQEEYQRIPLSEPQTVIIDRNGKHNEIRVWEEGVVMHASNCDSQDCIHQGEVTLENLETRILGGWIICLPNEIAIELVKDEGEDE